MAKKNLASLMSGIIGESSPSLMAENAPQEVAKTSVENISATPEKEAEKGTAKRGRPVVNKEPVTSVTFNAPESVLSKLKYISFVDGITQKDIIISSLLSYIDSWEAENGPVRLPKKKSKN